MNAKKKYSSHSPNSPLRGYEGVRGSGDGAVRNGTNAKRQASLANDSSRHNPLGLCLTLLRPMGVVPYLILDVEGGILGRSNGS